MDFFQCVSLEKAKEIINKSLADVAVKVEPVSLTAALGRISAEDIFSQEDQPPFDRSTVDGFAVKSADTFGASESSPVLLNVTAEVFMGRVADQKLESGEAAAIPTGGMLPPGADAVVMLEHVQIVDSSAVMVVRPAAPGENVIFRGEDVRVGTRLIPRGKKITPQDIAVLAACGHINVKVRKRPVVGIVSTGDEIVDAGEKPRPGQVRDVNSYAIAAIMANEGCEAIRYGIVPDIYKKLMDALDQASKECDLLLVSGGSSVGARDNTVKAIENLSGSKVLFHGVSVKPGKPTIYGLIGSVPVFGLPGHPVSAMVICDQIVRYAVRRMVEQEQETVFQLPAHIARNIASIPGRDDFLRVKITGEEGRYLAEPVLGKSGLVSLMARADGIVRIPSEKSGLSGGEEVKVWLVNQ